MPSGIYHLTTFIAASLGIIIGYLCAKKFKSWDLFFFILALAVGWFIHVIIYDKFFYIVQYIWQAVQATRGFV